MAEQGIPKTTYKIELEPIGRRLEIEADKTLIDAIRSAGVELESLCGGEGWCHTCVVRIIRGSATDLTLEEKDALSQKQLAPGYRLACQVSPLSDIGVYIPPESLVALQRLQLEGQDIDPELDPPIEAVDVQVPAPSLQDPRSDATRLQDALDKVGVGKPALQPSVLVDLSDKLRTPDPSVCAVISRGHIAAVFPGHTRLLGLAIDVGTTKLASYLIDFKDGRTVAKAGAMNPQIAFGEDVISRIAYSLQNADGRQVLQTTLIQTLNKLISGLCSQAGAPQEHVVEAVVVGNTAMNHLFAGLSVRSLSEVPYVPVISDSYDFPARDLGLVLAPGAQVHLPPNIAGFVGADHVAMVLATEIWKSPRTVLALDIGTNTEITLASHGRLICCSCASGPAFEGAHIHDGMRAAPGAIERLQIRGQEIATHTVGNQLPVGICGSGILDAVAELLNEKVLDRRGSWSTDNDRVRTVDGKPEFLLVPAALTGHGRDIVITRQDVGEIQLAKGAIRAGIQALLDVAGVQSEDVDEVIIAGAFGTYLDIQSALRIGMIPNLPINRIRQVGNAAGAGARQMVVSLERRRIAQEIAQREEYIELTTHPGFSRMFVNAMYFQ